MCFEKDWFLVLLLYGKRHHYEFSQFSKNAELLASEINQISTQH